MNRVTTTNRPHRFIAALGLVALLTTAACSDDKDDDTEPAAAAVSAEDLDGSSFASTSVEGQTLVEGSTITLDFAEGRISANAGCNTMNSSYAVEDGELKVDQMAQTLMACEEALQSQDEWVAAFLTSSPNIDLAGDVLTLTTDDTTLTLAAN